MPTAACPHFGECGGCAALDVAYPEQVETKRRTLRDLFRRDLEFEPSPDVFHYRNRMDFSIGCGGAGLFAKGSWRKTIDLRTCLLMSPRALPILRFARECVDRHGLPEIDRPSGAGFVRYLVLREGKETGEWMAGLVTSAEPYDPTPVCEALMAEFGLTCVSWQVHPGPSDLSRGEVRRMWGRDRIRERFGDVEVGVPPTAFLQPNTRAATILYRDLRGRVPAGAAVLDLYCGVGSISAAVRPAASRVTGVDLDPVNIQAARSNLPEAEFLQADAAKADWRGFDAVVVDPPRAGLHPKLARRLARDGPGLILYVSCNPQSLRRDLDALQYELLELKGYDFCPHTPHIESLAVLRRRRPSGSPPL
jgi:tRNA/tmRNA/rRNA uracil-C5-methylase (TrmA/RlmC/RlmD family)